MILDTYKNISLSQLQQREKKEKEDKDEKDKEDKDEEDKEDKDEDKDEKEKDEEDEKEKEAETTTDLAYQCGAAVLSWVKDSSSFCPLCLAFLLASLQTHQTIR